LPGSLIQRIPVWAIAALVAEAPLAAGGPMRLTGSIVGTVADSTGVTQMGAIVSLFNKYDRLVQRITTNDKGSFGFDTLLPDSYTIRVSLVNFVPAVKQNIAVQPGVRSFLAINLSTVLSSIQLMYSAPGLTSLMSDDWKWVLRSTVATRPVLRILPGALPEERVTRSSQGVFSSTSGVVKLSAGESSGSSAYSNQADLGTAFALATSLYGANRVQVSGNFGYSPATGAPTAGFQTAYRREADSSAVNPEIRLTMRQLYLPGRVGAGVASGQGNVPLLRQISMTAGDKLQLTENLLFQYGAAIDSVQFIDRLNYLSPYARASYELGEAGTVELGFSSGMPPVDLVRDKGESGDMHQNLASLALFPRLTLRGGNVQVQRTENYEIGYHKVMGSRTVSAAVYREAIANAGLTMSGGSGFYPLSDLLPDLSSSSSVFNIGDLSRSGYNVAVSQNLGENLTLALSYGRGGVLRTEQRELRTNDPAELRSQITKKQQGSVTGRVSGVIPGAGTKFSGSYVWTDYRSLTPGHMYLTQRTFPEAGLNLALRQPLPQFGGLPGRLEVNAEVRNAMAQGYLPFTAAGGRKMSLIHTPRQMRGGLSFFF